MHHPIKPDAAGNVSQETHSEAFWMHRNSLLKEPVFGSEILLPCCIFLMFFVFFLFPPTFKFYFCTLNMIGKGKKTVYFTLLFTILCTDLGITIERL